MTTLLDRTRCLHPNRIVGVDVARCVALLGMMGTHIVAEYASRSTNDYSWVHVAFAGRASALFCVLAGVSLSLTSWRDGRVRPGADYGIVVRAALIAVIGLTLELAGASIAIILLNYAVLFALGAALLRLPTVTLGVLATTWWLIGPITSYAFRASGFVPDNTFQVPSWLSLAEPTTLGWELLLTGYYPVWTWVAYLMVGMLIGRMDLRSPQLAWQLLIGGAAAAAVAWVVSKILIARIDVSDVLAFPPGLDLYGRMPPEYVLQSGFYGAVPTTSWWWLATHASHSGTPPEVLGTTGTALATLGAALLASTAALRHAIGTWLVWPFAATGSMTLTLYSLHILLLGWAQMPDDGIFFWSEIGTWPWTVQATLLVTLAATWSLTRLRGPLEMVLSAAASAARRFNTPANSDTPRQPTHP